MLVRDGGGTARNCELLVKVKGVTTDSHGASIGEKDGGGPGWKEGVGRQTPMSVLPTKRHSGGGGIGLQSGKLPSVARRAIIPSAAASPTATPGSVSDRLWVVI